jgi:hypothetical protein
VPRIAANNDSRQTEIAPAAALVSKGIQMAISILRVHGVNHGDIDPDLEGSWSKAICDRRATSLRTMAKKQYDATRKTLKHHGPYLPIILEACQEEQLSYEYRHGTQSYGAFTYSLAATLRASRGKKVNPSFVQLMDGVEGRLRL